MVNHKVQTTILVVFFIALLVLVFFLNRKYDDELNTARQLTIEASAKLKASQKAHEEADKQLKELLKSSEEEMEKLQDEINSLEEDAQKARKKFIEINSERLTLERQLAEMLVNPPPPPEDVTENIDKALAFYPDHSFGEVKINDEAEPLFNLMIIEITESRKLRVMANQTINAQSEQIVSLNKINVAQEQELQTARRINLALKNVNNQLLNENSALTGVNDSLLNQIGIWEKKDRLDFIKDPIYLGTGFGILALILILAN